MDIFLHHEYVKVSWSDCSSEDKRQLQLPTLT